MRRFQYVSGTFTDDYTGSHRVSGCDARQDRTIRDAKVLDPVHFKIAVNHRHGVSTHLGGTGLVPVARGGTSHGRELRNFVKELYNLYPLDGIDTDGFLSALVREPLNK